MSNPAPTKVRLAIVEANVSQRSFAEAVGIDETYLSRIVNGHVVPADGTRRKIARELGRTVDELWPSVPAEAA